MGLGTQGDVLTQQLTSPRFLSLELSRGVKRLWLKIACLLGHIQPLHCRMGTPVCSKRFVPLVAVTV